MKMTNLSKIAGLFQSASRIVLCTHVQPDGDALGSLLAAGMLLKALGKDVTLICHDPVPANLKILQGWETIKHPCEAEGEVYDLFCALDASDLDRIGDCGRLFLKTHETVVIDHHASNTLFGKHNYIVSTVAATGNLVYRLYQELKVPFNSDAAACLYAALSTDTGNFSFGQMDEEFFLQMAGLIKTGLDINKYSRFLHLTKEYKALKLKSKALASLSLECGGKLSYMRLNLEDFSETGTLPDQTDGLVNHALFISGVEMCFLATQLDETTTKFSLRALHPHDVAQIAMEFDGGGHVLASGCTLKLPVSEAVQVMLQRMRQNLCPSTLC